MRRIFLHFINRELHQSLDVTPNLQSYLHAIRMCTMFFPGGLACNISQIYELLYGEPNILDEILELNRVGVLELDASHSTVAEFFETRKKYYEHDIARYPMYQDAEAESIFRRSLIVDISGAEGTTDRISREMYSTIEDGLEIPRGVKRSEARLLRRHEDQLRKALNNREAAGLTFALFPARGVKLSSTQEVMALRRTLTASYINHYLDILTADIITGIRGIDYYDRCEPRSSIGHNIRYMMATLSLLGVGDFMLQGERWCLLDRIVCWNDEAHQLFADSYARLANGLDTAFSKIDESSNKLNWAIAKLQTLAIRIDTQKSLKDYYFAMSHSLRKAAEILRRDLEGFDDGWKASMTGGKMRVLLMTATDLEDEIFEKLIQEKNFKLVGEDRQGISSIQEYYGIPGLTLLHVRSSAGSIGPTSSALVAADAIKQSKARYVISCGICFGMDKSKLKLGDVLVSEQVALYEPGRVQSKLGQPAFVPRGGKSYAGATLLDRARVAKRAWKTASVRLGLLMSGEKLVDDPAFKDHLRGLEPEALGGEMEAAGIVSAADREKVEFIVIKGICDWGENKNKKHQVAAATNAFDFTFELIKQI